MGFWASHVLHYEGATELLVATAPRKRIQLFHVEVGLQVRDVLLHHQDWPRLCLLAHKRTEKTHDDMALQSLQTAIRECRALLRAQKKLGPGNAARKCFVLAVRQHLWRNMKQLHSQCDGFVFKAKLLQEIL